MTDGENTVVIDDRLSLICPECEVWMPVTITATVVGEPGEQRVLTDADLSDVWAHMWTHEKKREH